MIEVDPLLEDYREVYGNMTLATDRSALVNLARRACRVLEIGINEGATARLLLDNCAGIESYMGIDVPPDFVTELAIQQPEVTVQPGRWVKDDPRVEIILRPTQFITSKDISERDFAFIDADHSAAGVERDTTLSRACVKRGVIVWHDYRTDEPPTEVNFVLDRWVDAGAPIFHIKGTWIAFEMIA